MSGLDPTSTKNPKDIAYDFMSKLLQIDNIDIASAQWFGSDKTKMLLVKLIDQNELNYVLSQGSKLKDIKD